MLTFIMGVSALLAAALLSLVLWAFRRSAFSFEDAAITNLMAGIFWISGASLVRGIFWDVLPDVIGRGNFRSVIAIFGPTTWPNIGFYLIMILGCVRLLRGFLLMIPPADRKHYSLLTAAFYPRRMSLLGKKDSED